MTFAADILRKMDGLNKPRRCFMFLLFQLMLSIPGRMTFRNLSRYSEVSERTFTRHYDRDFDFEDFNRALLGSLWQQPSLLVTDCSFIAKSGKSTYGIDRFWNGCNSRNERGLEISVIGLVPLNNHKATTYTLSVEQTPPGHEKGRTQFYLKQLQQLQRPPQARYLAADGYYAKRDYIDGVCALDLHLISKLRSDANLRYLYCGDHPRQRGRRKLYDGKVDFTDTSRLQYLGQIEEGIDLYTAHVNSPHFKRNLRIAYLLDRRKPEKPRYVVLFSTDVEINAWTLVEHYRQRFGIEFIFRDAKQYTGLTHCQSRQKKRLRFHFNASL